MGSPVSRREERLAVDDLPILHVEVEPAPGSEALAARPVLAFAGIARPEKFFATLGGMGCRLVGRHAYPDHHRYTADEIMRLCEAAHEKGATPVTTEKDYVRLPADARPMVEVLRVRLVWSEPAALDRLLATLPEGR